MIFECVDSYILPIVEFCVQLVHFTLHLCLHSSKLLLTHTFSGVIIICSDTSTNILCVSLLSYSPPVPATDVTNSSTTRPAISMQNMARLIGHQLSRRCL